MKIAVGSTNPVKVEAVRKAVSPSIRDVEILSGAVESKVSVQPMSDEETKRGAYERAMGAMESMQADVGVGLEGGVFVDEGRVWNTVWCCVINGRGEQAMVNGARFLLPEVLSKELLKGKEMGPAMDSLTGIEDVRKKMGMIGVVTDGWVDREGEYCHLVRLAMGRLLSSWK